MTQSVASAYARRHPIASSSEISLIFRETFVQIDHNGRIPVDEFDFRLVKLDMPLDLHFGSKVTVLSI